MTDSTDHDIHQQINELVDTEHKLRAQLASGEVSIEDEQAKLDEIAKYSHYSVQRVKFLEDGTLVEEEIRKPKPAPRRRFR